MLRSQTQEVFTMPIVTFRAAALVLALSLLPLSASAMPDAQDGTPARASDPAERFAQMDADHDGNLTWEELSAARPNLNRNAFDTIDTNHDGYIRLDEWQAFSAGHGGSAGMPDMSSMMKAMRGAGDAGAAASSKGMPLVMPPAQSGGMTPAGAMPLITPPVEGK